MSFKTHLQELKSFLAPYQQVWNYEILEAYPNNMQGYPEDWTQELDLLDNSGLMDVAGRRVPSQLAGSKFSTFIQEVEKLSTLPTKAININSKVDPLGWMKISGKKQHEIKQLEQPISDLYQQHSLKHLIDIGGGQGFLAQSLAHYHGIKVITMDMNAKFQRTGKIRGKKRHIAGTPEVSYLLHEFKGNSKEMAKYFQDDTISLGLHTCGPLAIRHFESAIANNCKVLLNFGCCYNKMTKGDFNISSYVKNNGPLPPLQMTNEALTLATRSHAKMSTDKFDLKIMVKNFRYTFHLLQLELLGFDKFTTLGSTHSTIYRGDFAGYAKDQFHRLKSTKDLQMTDQQLNSFFEDPTIKAKVKEMILQGIFRYLFGRLIEIYLLLDRAIYLEENGYQVEIAEYFDEDISPRNIGVLAIH